MPIKQILALSAAVTAATIATHPTRPREAIRELQMKILRDARRTDNWSDCRQPFFGPCGDWRPKSFSNPRSETAKLKTVPGA